MKTDIILAGVGGQGILSIAAVIGEAAVRRQLYLKQAEVHGMSQRGGDVQSNLRLSDKYIFSDLISRGKADLVIALEPMEALRYAGWLKPSGFVVANVTPFVNIPDYPEEALLMSALKDLPNVHLLDVDALARDLGSAKVSNMVMLGAASPYIGLDDAALEEGIIHLFERKGKAIVEMNLKALAAGKALVNQP